MSERYQILCQLGLSPWQQQIRNLLDYCYPLPPRDVYHRLEISYCDKQPVWLAFDHREELVGFVYLIPTSKGGSLETLAVHPAHQGRGIAKMLIKSLLNRVNGVVTLTTRHPLLFNRFGFIAIEQLTDGSIFMYKIALGGMNDIADF